MTVQAWQRFSRAFACPVCGGYKEEQQHQGKRCWGFLFPDGKALLCERDEFAGSLHKGDWGYHHKLEGNCACGERHNSFDGVPAPAVKTQRAAAYKSGMVKPRGFVGSEVPYEIRDIGGNLVAIHIRRNFEDGGKDYQWRMPDGNWRLAMPISALPFYGSELLATAADDDVLMVCEGEKAAQSLRSRGYLALGTACGANSIPGPAIIQTLVRFKRVYLWPDNDDIGRSHMKRIAASLSELGSLAATIQVPNAQAKDDAADFAGDIDALLSNCLSLTTDSTLPSLADFDTESIRERLAEAFETIDWTTSQNIGQCGSKWIGFRCPDHHLICKPQNCGIQFCPNCGPKRFAVDWRQKLGDVMKDSLWDLYVASPLDGESVNLAALRKRFTKAKDRAKHAGIVVNAVYGPVYGENMRPTIIMAVPNGSPALENKNWHLEAGPTALTEMQTMEQFQVAYLREADSWKTKQDLTRLWDEGKGRHRFQAVGPMFTEGRDTAIQQKVAPPPSGGSGHGGGKVALACPICSQPLEKVGLLDPDQVVPEAIPGSSWHRWRPKQRNGRPEFDATEERRLRNAIMGRS